MCTYLSYINNLYNRRNFIDVTWIKGVLIFIKWPKNDAPFICPGFDINGEKAFVLARKIMKSVLQIYYPLGNFIISFFRE